MQKAFCQKEDGIYLSSQLLHTPFKKLMAQSPDASNKFCGRPCISINRCEAGNAAISVSLDLHAAIDDGKVAEEIPSCGSECAFSATSFASKQARISAREAQINASTNEKFAQFMKEVIPCCKGFDIRIAERLTHLQRVQGEFMDMRSEKLSSSLYDQASKALEWAMTCLDISDVVCDTKQSTIGAFFRYSYGFNLWPMIDEEREKIKQKLKIYINQLAISEDDTANMSTAAAVSQLLYEIERTDAARFFALFQELVKLQTVMNKILYCVAQHPQPCQPPLEVFRQLTGTVRRLSMDFVFCLKLTFWPSVATEWQSRDRLWPHQSVIDGIVGKGAHLVAKEFCHDDIDWRLSFSVAEIDLATRWSPVQHFVYFVFKSLFYKFIKPLSADVAAPHVSLVNKKYLASYTAKTVMMWTSESVHQSWWTEDNAAECLTVLLLALQSAFECRTLDHYFVSSVNLLDGISDVLASRVVETIRSIRADPAAVVAQLESNFENVEVFFNALPEHAKLVEPIAALAKLVSLLSRVCGECAKKTPDP